MSRGTFDGMPGNGIGFSERLNRKPAAMSMGTVRKTHVINGRVYADVIDDTGAAYHSKVPVMCFSGDPNRFIFVPVTETPRDNDVLTGNTGDPRFGKVEKDREVVLIHRPNGKPYVLGMPQHPDFGIQEEIEDDPGAADHGGKISKNDIAMRNSGGGITLDDNGAVTIDTTASGKRVRVQLGDDEGCMRVSRGGEAEESVLLAGPVIDHFIQQNNYFDFLEERIATLEAQVGEIALLLATGINVANNKTVPYILEEELDVEVENYPVPDDSLVSASIEISKKNKKDNP